MSCARWPLLAVATMPVELWLAGSGRGCAVKRVGAEHGGHLARHFGSSQVRSGTPDAFSGRVVELARCACRIHLNFPIGAAKRLI